MSTRELLSLNTHTRILGEDATASKTLLRAVKLGKLPFELAGHPPNPDLLDFCLIDPALALEHSKPAKEFPQPGLGYGAFTPNQRAAFLHWLDDPQRPAPMAFQQLYIAMLEVALFEGKKEAAGAQRELLRLDLSKHWDNHELLDRAILLSFWLAGDGASLARWLTSVGVSDSVLPIAIGQLALLGQPATLELLLALMSAWRLLQDDIPIAVVELRLNALLGSFEKGLLVHTVETAGETSRRALPWRCAHRDLRIALPQPNLRSILEPFLRETTILVDLQSQPETSAVMDGAVMDGNADNDDESEPASRADWNLILEFEHSRSSYFPFALEIAQRQEGYTLLMDENRRMIYRVRFRKNGLRTFWRMWDWVQPWNGTHVYVNGKELEKWQVWPYSQYLR